MKRTAPDPLTPETDRALQDLRRLASERFRIVERKAREAFWNMVFAALPFVLLGMFTLAALYRWKA